MPAPTRDLTGTVVAITGASAGIGAAATRLLVEAGATRGAEYTEFGSTWVVMADPEGNELCVAEHA